MDAVVPLTGQHWAVDFIVDRNPTLGSIRKITVIEAAQLGSFDQVLGRNDRPQGKLCANCDWRWIYQLKQASFPSRACPCEKNGRGVALFR